MRIRTLVFSFGMLPLLVPIEGKSAPAVEGAAIVRGRATIRIKGKDTEVVTGAVLGPGITMETKDEPLEMSLPDGVEIVLEPGSVAKWQEPGRLPTEKNSWAKGYVLALSHGELDVRIPSEPLGARAFLVSTKAGTLTGWRGSVHVSVKDESTTAASIHQGALVVGSNGVGFPVYDGAGVVMKKGRAPERMNMMPAPTWADGGNPFSVALGNGVPPLSAVWNPVPEAASYRVEFASEPTMVRTVRRTNVTDPKVEFQEPPGGAGRYFSRVRAVSKDGVIGSWSTPLPMRMVHPVLPPRALVSPTGAVVIPKEASLGLVPNEGLELAVHNVDGMRPVPSLQSLFFARAPREVRLGESPAKILFLKDTGSGKVAKLHVARRDFRADIELFPKRARWPEDPVTIRVTMRDPSGLIDVSKEEVKLSTMVNVNAVEPVWKREGASLVARVEPQIPPGPWVVRVRATDSQGGEIGMNFLEVDGPRRVTGGARVADSTEVRIVK